MRSRAPRKESENDHFRVGPLDTAHVHDAVSSCHSRVLVPLERLSSWPVWWIHNCPMPRRVMSRTHGKTCCQYFLVLHVANEQRHDVVEHDELDAANSQDDGFDLRPAFRGIQRREFEDILTAEGEEGFRSVTPSRRTMSGFESPPSEAAPTSRRRYRGHEPGALPASEGSLALPR